MSDVEEEKEVTLVCLDCARTSADGDITGAEISTLNFRSNAELLKKIHEIKTGHNPKIVQ